MAHRRMNNEGSIYYRPGQGGWCVQVSIKGHRLTKYARTQREARDWLKETLMKIGNGMTFESSRYTLEKFVEAWLNGKELSSRSQTIFQYRAIAQQHILPALGKIRLQDIQPTHLKQLYLSKKEEGRGARTVQMIHMVMYSILKQAVKEGILGRNPAESVQRPKVEVAERKILTEAQVRQLIIASKESRFGTLIYLALMTGMREGELLGLKWSDVDWDKSHLNIQRQLQRKGELVPPKTKAGKRQIKLGQNTLDKLARHREEQEMIKLANQDRWEENELIFPNLLGKPMAARKLLADFKRILQVNGLPDIRFHDLRHTALSFMLDLGTPINTVQKRAGHSKASVTTDTYGHALSHSEDEVVEKLEELVTPIAVDLQ